MNIDDQMAHANRILDNVSIDYNVERRIGEIMHRDFMKTAMLGNLRGGKTALMQHFHDALINGVSTQQVAIDPIKMDFSRLESLVLGMEAIKPRKLDSITPTGRFQASKMAKWPTHHFGNPGIIAWDDAEEVKPKVELDQPFWDLINKVKGDKLEAQFTKCRKESAGLCVNAQGQHKRSKQPNRGPVGRKDWK